MPRCNKCNQERTPKAFSLARKLAQKPCESVCNICQKEPYIDDIIKCSICNKSKSSYRYGVEMIVGLKDKVCHDCNNKQNGIRPGKKKQSETTKRICLKCDRPFYSAHKFNKICQRCKDGEDFKKHEQWE